MTWGYEQQPFSKCGIAGARACAGSPAVPCCSVPPRRTSASALAPPRHVRRCSCPACAYACACVERERESVCVCVSGTLQMFTLFTSARRCALLRCCLTVSPQTLQIHLRQRRAEPRNHWVRHNRCRVPSTRPRSRCCCCWCRIRVCVCVCAKE